uniref:Ubiquitin-like domain-containing protein n=1 Tax=Theileria annulata TaxID=5874 RepID=A0A3B0MPG8_THEAN
MVKLLIYDYVTSTVGNRIILEVEENEKISKIIDLIVPKIKENVKKSCEEKSAKNNSINIENGSESLLLYLGTTVLENCKTLDHYNVSSLSELSLCLYPKVDVKVTVTVLKGINCFGIKYTPIFSLLLKNKIKFDTIDQETILEIKKKILSVCNFSNKKGEELTLEKLNLFYKTTELNDNFTSINELNCKNKLKLKLLIPYGYSFKKLKPESESC